MPANDKRVVKVNKRSGFDKSFRNSLTAKCGTLVPILVDEVIPDTKVNLKINLAASMPPLVSDTYMNVRLRVEAFAVPHRLTQANFEDFYCDYPGRFLNDESDVTSYTEGKGCMPLMLINADDTLGVPNMNGLGSLCDYMGIPQFAEPFPFEVPVNVFCAYWLIWQEWYRNPRVQTPAFVRSLGDVIPPIVNSRSTVLRQNSNVYAACLPYQSFFFDDNGKQPLLRGYLDDDDEPIYENYKLHNGSYIYELAQRNFGLDFFTAAMLEPQQGDNAAVKIDTSIGDDGGFTISALRAQNSIQQWRERNMLTSPRYQQQIYARYGCAPSDGVIQRPILIGAATYDVYSHGVTTSANGSIGSGEIDNYNPFGGNVGARYGNSFASGSDFIISGFHAKEPMYIIVLASLVPEVSYSQNMNFIHLRYKGLGSITDMANPILQSVGPQPIPCGMLGMAMDNTEFDTVFAYTDRYSDWMFRPNEVHGKFKEYGDGDLKNFVLQRTFSGCPSFGSEFLTIPTDYLDGVLQFTSETIGLTYWLDVMFDYKVSMPLQEYAIPSLQDPGYEHGRSIVLH